VRPVGLCVKIFDIPRHFNTDRSAFRLRLRDLSPRKSGPFAVCGRSLSGAFAAANPIAGMRFRRRMPIRRAMRSEKSAHVAETIGRCLCKVSRHWTPESITAMPVTGSRCVPGEIRPLVGASRDFCPWVVPRSGTNACRRELCQARRFYLTLETHHAGEIMATEPYHDDPGVRHAATQRSPVETRQGVISGRVFLVLVSSTIAAIIALVVAYFVMR
jgi:hypothetical protein